MDGRSKATFFLSTDNYSNVNTTPAMEALVPIVAGVAFLQERPGAVQWGGVGLVMGGLVLLGAVA